MNAGHAPSAGVTGNTVDLSWTASTTSNGVPATGYLIRRHDSTGTVQQTIAAGTCASQISTTGCSETSVPDGTWTYSVIPAYGNWRGAAGPKTAVTVATDTVSPTAAMSFPVSGSSNSDSTYTAGCGTASTGDLCGTASDTGSGVVRVQVSVQRGTGSFWNGSGFTSTTEVLVDASGTTSWSYGLAAASFPADGAYTVRVRATDNQGNVGTATSTFTLDRTAPPTPSITSAPASPSSSQDANFSFTDTESPVSFECRLDGSPYTTCSDPNSYTGLADGTHVFDVRAFDAAGNRSTAASHTWTIDILVPAVSISFPASGSAHNDAGFTAGCSTASTGDLCGTASDSGTGVTRVEISVQQGSGLHWQGTGFSSTTETWFVVNGTAAWSYPFAASDFPTEGPYTLRARATDATGKVTATSSTFTVDRTAPTATDIQAFNGAGGTVSRIEAGDAVTFTFSEAMSTGSILAGWSGASTNVVVRLNDGGAANDTLTVYDASNVTSLPLGTVDLGRADYASRNYTFGTTGTPSTMVQAGASITMTLGARGGGPAPGTVSGTSTMAWTPSASATDVAGNAAATTTLTEPGTADRDF